jgi:folylpolyglutamate synthase/dihydropteroate synthase
MKTKPPSCKDEYERDCKGIENMRILCNLLDNPQDGFKYIHVSGTNGKGSVTIKSAFGLAKLHN